MKKISRIAIIYRAPSEVINLLGGAAEVVLAKFGENQREEMSQAVLGANAIMLSSRDVVIDETLLSRCPSLRIIALTFKRPDNIDVDACTRHGVWVAAIPDASRTPPSNPDPALDFALEAAANIFEALTGSEPKGAINRPLRPRRLA